MPPLFSLHQRAGPYPLEEKKREEKRREKIEEERFKEMKREK